MVLMKLCGTETFYTPRTHKRGEWDNASLLEPESDERPIAMRFFSLLLLPIACQAIASQLVKVWLPEVLAQSGALPEHGRGLQTFTLMWAGECMGIMIVGLLLGNTEVQKDERWCCNFRQLDVATVAFLCSSASVLGNLRARDEWLLSGLGCMHLLGQACAFNFFFAFATVLLPVATRARCIACFFAVSYAGVFIGPFVGSMVLTIHTSERSALAVVSVATCIYLGGAIACLRIRQLLAKGCDGAEVCEQPSTGQCQLDVFAYTGH